jgi:hypothetical protein
MLPCRGERWVLLGLLQVNTLISDIPVDPVEAKKAKIAFLQEEIDSSTASIIVDVEFDMMQSGSVSYANYTSRRVEVDHMIGKCAELKLFLPLASSFGR